MDKENMKRKAGHLAASLVEKGMILGLGTGSTVYYFIEKLIERNRFEQLEIRAVSTSNRSQAQAEKGGIPLMDINDVEQIDLTVDGADEIDQEKRMIKGGGGALLREKIIANLSKEMVVVVDETKLVPLLGSQKLPVEIVPFAHQVTLHHIQKIASSASLRKAEGSNDLYLTDNGNYIVDLFFDTLLDHPETQHAQLKAIPGVVETGFFFHLAGRVIVGHNNGQVTIQH